MRVTPAPDSASAVGDNALGPWSAVLLHTRPQKLVLAVCNASRHALVLPAAPLASLPGRLPDALFEVLMMCGAPVEAARKEANAMQPLVLAPTIDRGVRSHIGQYRDEVTWCLAAGDSLSAINLRLANNLVLKPYTGHVGERSMEMLGLDPAPLRALWRTGLDDAMRAVRNT